MKSSLNLKPLENYNADFKRFDWNLVILVSILSLFGILMIYSASSYNALNQYNDSLFYVKKQSAAFIIGIIFMIAVSFINLDILYKLRYVILAVSYILLILVFVPGLGIENYGAKRWINLGFFTFQASEISKFGLMIFIAAFMSKHSVAKFKGFFFILLLGLITAALIMLEPNMSITMCVIGSVLIMLFIGGAKIKYFVLLILPLLGAVILLIVIEPYRMSRLIAFIDPWASPRAEGYQLIQSFYSLGSGGLFGVGLFNSRQKYMFLPFSESDFILSIIGEELGLCGITLIMVIFIMLIFKGIKIAGKAEDRFRSYLAFSIIIVIAIQSALNIAVVSGAIPPTGLPLPFISSGGSSLVSFLTASGILLNISNHAF